MMQYLGDLSFELTFKKSNCAKLKIITSLAGIYLMASLLLHQCQMGYCLCLVIILYNGMSMKILHK
jgi:hypothetical protein